MEKNSINSRHNNSHQINYHSQSSHHLQTPNNSFNSSPLNNSNNSNNSIGNEIPFVYKSPSIKSQSNLSISQIPVKLSPQQQLQHQQSPSITQQQQQLQQQQQQQSPSITQQHSNVKKYQQQFPNNDNNFNKSLPSPILNQSISSNSSSGSSLHHSGTISNGSISGFKNYFNDNKQVPLTVSELQNTNTNNNNNNNTSTSNNENLNMAFSDIKDFDFENQFHTPLSKFSNNQTSQPNQIQPPITQGSNHSFSSFPINNNNQNQQQSYHQQSQQQQFKKEQDEVDFDIFASNNENLFLNEDNSQNYFSGMVKYISAIEDQYQQNSTTISSLNQKILLQEEEIKSLGEKNQQLYGEKHVIQMKFKEIENQFTKSNFEIETMKGTFQLNQSIIKEIEEKKNQNDTLFQSIQKKLLDLTEENKSSLNSIEIYKMELDNLTSSLTQKEHRESQLLNEIKDLKITYENEIKEYQDKVLKSKLDITNLESNIKTSIKKRSALESEIKDKTHEIEKLSKEISDLNSSSSKLSKELSTLRATVQERSNELDILNLQYKEIQERFNENLNKISKEEEENEELQNRIKQVQESLTQCIQERDQLSNDLHQSRSQFKEYSSKVDIEINRYKNSLGDAQKSISTNEEKYNGIHQELLNEMEKNSKLSFAKDQQLDEISKFYSIIAERDQKIVSLNSKIEKLESDTDNLNRDRELKIKTIQEKNKLYESLETRHSTLKSEFNKINSSNHEQISSLEQKLNNNEKIIQEKEIIIKQLKENNSNSINVDSFLIDISQQPNVNQPQTIVSEQTNQNLQNDNTIILNTPPIPTYNGTSTTTVSGNNNNNSNIPPPPQQPLSKGRKKGTSTDEVAKETTFISSRKR